MYFRIILALVFTFGILSSSAAQTVGGYHEQSVKDAEVRKAVQFALQAQQKNSRSKIVLQSIRAAQTQVVAGMNYRLCLRTKVRKTVKSAVVVVYRNLQNEYALTSWDWQDCK